MTDDKVIDLDTKRPPPEESEDWTVARALKKTLEQALSEDYNWTKCFIILHNEADDGTFTTDTRIAGCSTLEARGMLFNAIREDMLEFLFDDDEPAG